MLSKLQKSNNKGFTIIEVMIVLAIAGLIILIVLLAVPALQRNGRNTALKNDASAIAAAVSTFQSDNDGAMPTGISANGLVTGAGGTSEAQARIQGGTVVDAQVTAVPAALVPHGHIQYWLGHRCNGGVSARAIAIWYSVETSGTETAALNNKCIDA
jgi:prepilin-type N-terminal cleavage/methylation domain-containing protein